MNKVGLENLTNTCYMNSTIQCLRHIKSFTEFLLSHSFQLGTVVGEFTNVLKNLFNNRNKYFSPERFKYEFQNKCQMFRNNQQDDSAIFLANLLKLIHNELKKNNLRIENELEKFNEYSIEKEIETFYLDNKKTIINKIFTNFIYTKTIYQNRKEEDPDIENVYYINLPIKHGKNIFSTLEECIIEFQKQEIVSDSYTREKYEEKVNIVVTGDVLIFNLLRVVKGMHLLHNISYPEILDVSKIGCINPLNKSSKFELIGFVKHIGNQYGGHKVAICKDSNSGKWYEFNDKNVYELPRLPQENLAFLLFYERKDLEHAPLNNNISNTVSKKNNFSDISIYQTTSKNLKLFNYYENNQKKEKEKINQFCEELYQISNKASVEELLNKFQGNEIDQFGALKKDDFLNLFNIYPIPEEFNKNAYQIDFFKILVEYQNILLKNDNKKIDLEKNQIQKYSKDIFEHLNEKSKKKQKNINEYFKSLLNSLEAKDIYYILINKTGYKDEEKKLKNVLSELIKKPVNVDQFIKIINNK